MARSSVGRRVTGALADATGKTDEEVRVTLTLAGLGAGSVAGLLATLRILNSLSNLGVNVLGHSRKESAVAPLQAPSADVPALHRAGT